MKSWFSIKAVAAGSDTTEISISDEIGVWGVSAKEFNAALKSVSTPNILLTINSPGGSVFDAIAMFNGLRATKKTITVKVLGVAASAASYIAMAGDRIEMPENSFMFIHNPIAGVYGNAVEMRELADVLEKVGGSLTKAYADRWKLEEEQLLAELAAEQYLTAAECFERGLCDEVTPAMALTAKFDTDRLPDNVKASLTPKVDPEPVVEPSIAALIETRAAENGLTEFAATWAADPSLTSAKSVSDAVKQAVEVRAYCKLTGLDSMAAKFIRSRVPVAEARAAMAAELAKRADETHVDTSEPTRRLQSPTQRDAINPVQLWQTLREAQAALTVR